MKNVQFDSCSLMSFQLIDQYYKHIYKHKPTIFKLALNAISALVC